MNSVAGNAISRTYRYAAFISYARCDEPVAKRLQRRLETFSIHKSIQTDERPQLRPIFRDRTELAAHGSIGNAIQDGLRNSRCLIVLCSPAAKASKWVGEEIRLFRELHPDGQIFSALVDGSPETAFPAELTLGGNEPLAADLSGGPSSEKFGVRQLVASLLGVPLDAVLRRDADRRRRNFVLLSTVAIGFSTMMAALALVALSAQKQAERNREDAEGLVEFMLTDFEVRLRELGRLDVLSDVGEKVVEYYQDQPIENMASDRLSRRSRARHLLGQVALSTRNIEKAEREVTAAYELTKVLLERDPDSADLIFDHAQSAYWRGEFEFRLGGTDKVRPYWEEYRDLSDVLYRTDPKRYRAAMERGWGELNLGALSVRQNRMQDAYSHYEASLAYFEEAEGVEPDNLVPKRERANALGWMADQLLLTGGIEDVRSHRQMQLEILDEIRIQLPKHKSLELTYITPVREVLILEFLEHGEFSNAQDWQDYGRVVEELHDLDGTNAATFREFCHAHLFPALTEYLDGKSIGDAGAQRARVCENYLLSGNTFGAVDEFIASMWEVPISGAASLEGLRMDLSGATEQQKLFAWYLHLRILVRDGYDIAAENLAQTILEQSVREPKSVQQLLSEMTAFAVIGDCGEASRNRLRLRERGYAVPVKAEFKSVCSAP